MPYDLIIFDCDGTLVDSERLYNTIASELLAAAGLPQYTPERCFKEFSGQSWNVILARMEERHGVQIPQSLVQEFVELAKMRIETELKPVDNVHAMLEQIVQNHHICIGSNGEHDTILKSLEVTGLDKFFPEEHVFSKIMVENPKPAPDLFFHCADKMNVLADRCLVIEDSVAGVRAGAAAGMTTLGFYGTALDGAEHKDDQIEAGAHETICCLIHIPDFIETQKRLLAGR
jgi:HAD superfamily hydrolase (TIGR01509 family)